MELINKKIVVTGANGFIGRAFCQYLDLINHTNYIAIDICSLTNSPNFKKVDITTPGILDNWLDENTLIVHLAGHADVKSSVEDPLHDFRLNMIGTINILESVRKSKCSLTYPSTSSIFDLSKRKPLTENSLKNPTSPYGASKMGGEAYCKAYARSYGLDIKIVRLFSVYGPGMNRFLIYDIVKKLVNNPTQLTVFGDGMQIRDYLYISDVVRGIYFLACKGEIGEDYNLASGNPLTVNEVVDAIIDNMDLGNVKIEKTNKLIEGEVSVMYANIDKITSLGFVPEYSFEKGLKLTIESILNDGK